MLICVLSFGSSGCQYLPSDWLKDFSEEAHRGEGIISTKPRPKSVYDFV